MNATPPSSKLALWLSAVVCPGAGQFLQCRPLAGSFYLAAFLACLAMLVWTGLMPWCRILAQTLDAAEHKIWIAPPEIGWLALVRPVAIWAGLALIVHVANVIDAGLAHRRIMRAWNMARAGLQEHCANLEAQRANS